MHWSHLLAKLSPERVQPILREGQCKPPADYNNGPNMPSDHRDSPPEQFDADDQEERSSIGNFSLLAPPIPHRQPHYPGPQPEQHQPQAFLEGITTLHDPPVALATTMNSGSSVAPSVAMRAIAHTDYADILTLPNSHLSSPHPPWMHGQAPLPNISPPQQQPLYRDDAYAPAESLPPQNYIPSTRIAPSSGAPYTRPGSRGASLFFQRRGVSPPVLSIPIAVVPPNSELARSPRFTFARPGDYVPADPIVSTTAAPASPKSAHSFSFRDKGRIRFDLTARQPTEEGSVGRARSNSWTVVSSVFRRRSGRRPGPTPLITDADVSPPPQLTASNWRDLAHWAFRPTDHNWGESFASHVEIAPPPPIDLEAISNFYDRSLPPLPLHLSHLPAPSAPLLRTNSLTSALNPFLIHRHTGVPPISWDLRTSARSVLFPTSSSGPGPPAQPSTVPMALSDYAQPATWPPCGALRIGAIGGRASVWLWPVDVRNPAGVRCGDVFRALIENLHQFVRPDELADMIPEQVSLAGAACAARVWAGLPHGSSWSSDPSAAAATEGIRRVDLLLGHTQFYGLVPGPSPGEWTMYVGVL